MILVADSGSTKCDWIIIDNSNTNIKTKTMGFNPFFHSTEFILGKIQENKIFHEISYQLDAGIEYNSTKFAIGASPFFNYFSNYIYLNPTSRYDRLYGFGNQVFEYTESEILRYGGELHAHYEATTSLRFGFIGEYVYA